MEERNCQTCGKTFKVWHCRKQKFCSLSCRPSWNRGTKGMMKAWNKGIPNPKAYLRFGEHAQKGHQPWNTGKFMAEAPNWKGDKVTYSGLHAWVRKSRGQPLWCMKCGSCTKVEWANISHEYKRDLLDWMELCHKCHLQYDRANGWGKAREIYGKNYNFR